MHEVLILGAGKIGSAIAMLLARSGDFDILVGDYNAQSLEHLRRVVDVPTQLVDVTNPQILREAMKGRRSVVSACSFSVNPGIAQAALEAGISYFDLTEDVATSRDIRRISQDAVEGQIFMPQCGLAPGFVSIAAHHVAEQFGQIDEVRLRVARCRSSPPTR